MPWESQLIEATDKEATAPTIRKAMRLYYNYGRYIAAQAKFVRPETRAARIAFAQHYLEAWDLDDWKRVRFSDEVHFGWREYDGRTWVSRQRGHRYSPGILQDLPNEGEDRREPRVHCWAAVGWNFKTNLVRYWTPNAVGKMTQAVYIDQILEPHVRPWLKAGDHFIMLEDNDSGHIGRRSMAWKDAVGAHFFMRNAPLSPDLNVIENCWRAPGHKVRLFAQFADDADDLYARAKEGWDGLRQRSINEWVLSMPKRLEDVIERDGRFIKRERLDRELEAELEVADSEEEREDR